jgi:hypothetical protein
MPEAWLQPKNMPSPRELEIMESRVYKKFTKIGGFKAGTDPKLIEKSKMIVFEPQNCYPSHDVPNATVTMRYHVRMCFGQRIRKSTITNEFASYPEVIADFMIDVDKFVKDYKPI